MFKIILAVLATVVILPCKCLRFAFLLENLYLTTVSVALAQDPIYVPFEWDKIPLTATNLGSSGGQTTFGLLEGPSRARATVGPGMFPLSDSLSVKVNPVFRSCPRSRSLWCFHALLGAHRHALRCLQPR